jgi:hypothetical protein
MKHARIIFFICLLSIIPALAQEEREEQEELEERETEKRNSLAFVFGYTHIPEATKDGKVEEAVFVATVGLDYFYELSEKWFVGGAFDMELGKYEVDYEDDEISREIAVVLGALVGYEVAPGWAVLAGPGIEFEKNKNLFVLRFGTEYTFELGNDWGLFPSFTYDFKKEYSAYALGVGLKKRF